jgi:uncharacterized protein YndB with AHSA1/START domain
MGSGKEEGVRPATTQIHEIYIKATPQAIWDAITEPGWTEQYGYRGRSIYDLRKGGKYEVFANAQMRSYGLPEVVLDGVVEEAHPPFKLVHTLRFLFTDANKAEGFTRITWEIAPTQSGFCRLTVIHEVEGAPMMAAATDSQFNEQGAGGWTWVISDLKSLLETGKPLGG